MSTAGEHLHAAAKRVRAIQSEPCAPACDLSALIGAVCGRWSFSRTWNSRPVQNRSAGSWPSLLFVGAARPPPCRSPINQTVTGLLDGHHAATRFHMHMHCPRATCLLAVLRDAADELSTPAGVVGWCDQGKIEDCWFLSAAASLFASAPASALARLIDVRYSGAGGYIVRFTKAGKPVEVVIDDRLPHGQEDGQPVGAAGGTAVQLLEKAYAK